MAPAAGDFFLSIPFQAHGSTGSRDGCAADRAGKESRGEFERQRVSQLAANSFREGEVSSFAQPPSHRFVLLPRKKPFHPGIAGFEAAYSCQGGWICSAVRDSMRKRESTLLWGRGSRPETSSPEICDEHHRFASMKERRMQRMCDAPHKDHLPRQGDRRS